LRLSPPNIRRVLMNLEIAVVIIVIIAFGRN
jgi:hypothetical protein